jgi:hypothetical protein
MWLLFAGKGIPEAASWIFAVMFAVSYGFLFGRGLSQTHSPQALRTTKSFILQLERLFDGHELPPEDAILCRAVPSFHFYITDLIHNPLPGVIFRCRLRSFCRV